MSINNSSEEDIEKITYETAMLVAAGWRRIRIADTKEYKELSNKYKFDSFKYVWVWVKPPPFTKIIKNTIWLNHLRHYDLNDQVEVLFFDREKAYKLLTNNI